MVQIADDNKMTVRLDNGKTVELAAYKARFIEHGYTVEGTKNFHAHRVLVSIGGPGEVAAESALARAISRSSASTTFYTSDGPSLAEAQAAERARIANVGRLVIDRTLHSAPMTAEIARHFPAVEVVRHYAAIRQVLAPEDAAQFQCEGETSGVQTYRNNETGRNIHIDAKGQFYSQDGKPTSQEAALEWAMPTHQTNGRFEIDRGLGVSH